MKKASIILLFLILIIGCKQNKNSDSKKSKDVILKKGTFGYDKVFLKKHYKNTIILESKNKKSVIALTPELQGRVMTSSLNGNEGMSFGWLNYDLISSKNIQEHINVTGGEERFWLGPEGGQYSIFFKKGTSFDFKNWYVPASLDTETFNVLEKKTHSVTFQKELNYTNYSGTKFNLTLNRKVSLLNSNQVKQFLNIDIENVSVVAYESQNIVKNIGNNAWEEKTGLLSIWLLGMMNSSPQVTVVAPINKGDESELGPKVNDNYFGKIDSTRLKTTEQNVFFKADGNSRGKIGISPLRATKYIGSYDAKNIILTILEISKPNTSDKYVNSSWELQKFPYSGDVLNSYNDGKLDDGTQLGPFYELESSSPALNLSPNESYNHTQRMYHFKGDTKTLNQISENILNTSLEKISKIFN